MVDPRVIASDGATSTEVSISALASRAAGRDVLLATHGFNVSREDGIRSLARLEARLRPTASELFLGVLWPGDFWIPVVNYPSEAADAVECGVRLARFCDQYLRTARSLSFLSHSLGGRVILEAAANLGRQPKHVCLTAAAVDWDCLEQQYAEVVRKAGLITVLSSRADVVLKLAYPAGDFFSDLFWGDNDNPFSAALGRQGPRPVAPDGVVPWQIPDDARYGHGDYLPPSDTNSPPPGQRWEAAADFMARAFRGQPQLWP